MNNSVLGKIFIGIVLVVIVVVTVIQLAQIASPGGDDDPTPSPDEIAREFVDYDNEDSELIFIIDGPVEAREEHERIRMTISASNRRIEVIDGYSNNVLTRRNYGNDLAAYRVFIRSVEYEGFDLMQEGTAETEDERGVCPLGRRYIAELKEDSSTVFRTWRASCSSKLGTFAGDLNAVAKLFKDQFPDYRDITTGVSIR